MYVQIDLDLLSLLPLRDCCSDHWSIHGLYGHQCTGHCLLVSLLLMFTLPLSALYCCFTVASCLDRTQAPGPLAHTWAADSTHLFVISGQRCYNDCPGQNYSWNFYQTKSQNSICYIFYKPGSKSQDPMLCLTQH